MNDPIEQAAAGIDNFNARGVMKILSAVKQILEAFLLSLARPLVTLTEALMREDFGERYFTWWNVYAGMGLLVCATLPSILYKVYITQWTLNSVLESWKAGGNLAPIVGVAWLIAFIVLGLRHLKRIRERNEQGVLWHSYSCGCSWLDSHIPFTKQPLIPIVIGIILIVCRAYGLGALMVLSGYFCIAGRLLAAKMLYTKVLDIIDAQIEQENLSDAVLKKSNPRATSGFVAPLPAHVSMTHREKFLRGVGVQPKSAQANPSAAAKLDPVSDLAPRSLGQHAVETLRRSVSRMVPPMINWVRSMERKTKITFLLIVGLILCSWSGWGYYLYFTRVPGNREVRAAIEHVVNSPSQRLVDVSTKVTGDFGGNEATLQFSATMETSEPLYTQVGVSQYLRESGADSGVYDRIQNILAGPGGDWIRGDAGTAAEGRSIGDVVLLRESAKADTHYAMTGDVQARRPGSSWELQVANVHVDGAPAGSPRSSFVGNVLLLDRPDDVQKFKASLAEAQAVLTRLEQSQHKYSEKVAKESNDHRQALLSKIAPGTLFRGSANQGTETPQSLWLEITDLDPERKTIRALLRNDGGWDDARRFEGTFDPDKAPGFVSVILKTDASQLLQSCGPFLEWNQTFQWSLQLEGDTLTGKVPSSSYRFERLADDTKKQAEIAFARDYAAKWLAATKAGMVYKLTASIPDRAWSEEYFFSFTRQDKDGLVIEAVLELPSRGFRRKFTGTLITNKYKADRRPLRLIAHGGDAIREADASSPLAETYDFSWYPQLDDGRMRMDANGQRWDLQFAPSTAEELAKARNASGQGGSPSQTKFPEIPNPVTQTRVGEDTSPATGEIRPSDSGVAADQEQLRVAAAKGDAAAQGSLGLAYLNGTGVLKDRVQAEKWLRLSADQGNAPAQFALAELMTGGGAVNSENRKLYRLSADQGYAPAQCVMGELNMKGGIPDGESLNWFRKAADQGNILAEFNLGCFYKDGVGVRKDPAEAATWFRKAAEQNDRDSQEALAEMYADGVGVRKDPAEAFRWYKKAAEQGDPVAEWNLAAAYTNGSGVAKDAAEALKWLRSAAQHGNADAQKLLRNRDLPW